MDARERYFWDLTGYLVVRNVLTAEELSECNAAIDHCMERMQQSPDNGGARGESNVLQGTGQQTLPNLLELPHPHCEPFRRLLVHPQVVSRLNAICGKGFRHDHGPWVSYSPKGTEGLILHGAGEPHRPYVAYHHQNGQFHCAGVTVTWQLADCKAGDGGFACVPGSHKAKFPMPAGVRSCDEPLDVVHQPALKAGDVIFFMDGAQTHGTLPWTGDAPRRSALYKYASRTATRSGVSIKLAAPEVYWDEAIVEGMTPEQRAVMYGPCSSISQKLHLQVDADGNVVLGK